MFDNTISGLNSNSYVSVETADTFFSTHLDGAEWWTPLPTVTKQAALVQATTRIDNENFAGVKSVEEQSLMFPRKWIVNRDRVNYIDSTTIPKQLVEATCELALNYIKIKAGEYTVDENDLETMSSYKIGPVDVTIRDGIKADRLPTKVKGLLRAIGYKAWMGDGEINYIR